MIEKIGHIKNPLTVIAIFAGLAEISGTVVLPFIAPEIQRTYVWFLMLFPAFLVGVFFYTLHKSPASLYSPSDYQNEDNFVKSVRRITPDELTTKWQSEAKEVESDLNKDHHDASQLESPVTPSKNEFRVEDAAASKHSYLVHTDMPWAKQKLKTQILSNVAAAEKLAVTRLSKELGIGFRTDVHFALDVNWNMSLDAYADVGETTHFVEVKFFATSSIDVTRFYKVLDFAREVTTRLKRSNRALLVHLFIVSNADVEALKQAEAHLQGYASRLGVAIKVHTAQMAELADEVEFD